MEWWRFAALGAGTGAVAALWRLLAGTPSGQSSLWGLLLTVALLAGWLWGLCWCHAWLTGVPLRLRQALAALLAGYLTSLPLMILLSPLPGMLLGIIPGCAVTLRIFAWRNLDGAGDDSELLID